MWLKCYSLTTSVVIGIECICSCKSNYHTIMATTAPFSESTLYYWRCTTLCNKVYQRLAKGQRFSPVRRFPPPIKLTPRYNWNIVEREVKNHNQNPNSWNLHNKMAMRIATSIEIQCLFIRSRPRRPLIWRTITSARN
jgi:hypothetical protein